MAISYHSMTIQDYDQCLALWQGVEGVCIQSADSKASIQAYLERNPGLSYVARDEQGLVVGAVLCGHDGRRGFLHHVAVEPSHRRKGIATSLVTRALEALTRAGIEKCHIFVLNDNAEGLAFWKKSGWIKRRDIVLMSMDVPRTSEL
ncbi:MAG TPA: GNAT family N-acetyltransferase [Verrucomicrobia bacterium]|nr:MAG: GNAT family N-acetyltransferase [Lentisphaerae bacterium GWF2_57_35]HBA83956.1 GNAT family N-acetyltransferase [Verrucomicrobiota bacterium]